MEIIFGRNKKEQLEPVSARVTGEASMLRWASLFLYYKLLLEA